MRHLRLPAAIALLLVAAPAAHAAWGPPLPLAPGGQDSNAIGVASMRDDRPSVLYRSRSGGVDRLLLRRAAGPRRALAKPVTIATSRNYFEGEGLFAGGGDDLIAGWLEIVNGSRRPVVATGPALADRQVLAPGPRSTQIMDLAANRRGDAVVAFWRYAGPSAYSIYAAYRRRGERFGAAQLLATGLVGDPAVAIDAGGAAVVGWTEKPGVTVASRPRGATAFGAPSKLASPRQANGEVGVAIENGRALVSWVTGPNSVLVAERPAGAAPFTDAVAVSAQGISAPRQAPEVSLDAGRAIVAWTQRKTGVDSAAVAIAPAGGAFQAPIVRGVGVTVRRLSLLAGTANLPPLLAMATSSRGSYTATIRADGTLAPSRRIAITTTFPVTPSLAQGVAHSFLVVTRNLGSAARPSFQGLLYRSN